MQVRRKTPILEARQFTEESAQGLIKDGWLYSTVSTADGTTGLLTWSASRSRDVHLGDWIVLEEWRDVPVDEKAHLSGGEAIPIHSVPIYRPVSAEQFTEDFEVVAKPGQTDRERRISGLPDIGHYADPANAIANVLLTEEPDGFHADGLTLESQDALIDTGDGAGAPPKAKRAQG